MTSPRHPGVETALTREDIAQGVTYVTYIPGDRVIERGTFMSEADYDENDNRWNALAIVQRGAHDAFNKTVCLYDAGITPDQDGESWSTSVTVADTE